MKYRAWIVASFISGLMMTRALGGEIALPKHHIGITLPDRWQQVPDQTAGILVRAQSDSGRLRLMLTRPPVPMKPAPVQDSGFQSGVKRSLVDQGFTKIVRSEVIKVAGSEAYLCEATREDRPHSIMQVVWFHEAHPISLVFLSLANAFKDVSDIQAIIDSVRVLPKQ
jgi:hypothetical protein